MLEQHIPETDGSRIARRATAALACAIAAALQPTSLRAADLPQVVPADAVVAYFVTPTSAQSPTDDVRSPLAFATLLAAQAQNLGLLANIDPTTRAWIDTLTSVSVLLGYPHAAALLDIEARRLDRGGHRLAGLRAALIIKTQGDHGRIEQRIQHLLNTYTNQRETTLAREGTGPMAVYTLTDKRLPPWLVLRWGPVGEMYLVSIGAGTFQRLRQTFTGKAPAIASSSWFAEAFNRTEAKGGFFTLFARFDRIDFSADTELAHKVGAVRRALNFQNVDRGMWTIGFKSRAVDAQAFVRRSNENRLTPITLPSLPQTPVDRLIPRGATAYAIFDSSPGSALDAACEVYLAARSKDSAAKARAYWRSLQEKAGVDIRRDIVDHLARGAVIHNHPPQLLRIPLAWTYVARIKDDTDTLRRNIDALCNAWQVELSATGAVHLHRADDRVWYLDLGFPGPAVGIKGPWIVVSHSPFAVRENLTLLAGPAGGPKPPATGKSPRAGPP